MRVAVLNANVPFVRGGAEELRDHLVLNLRKAGVDAESYDFPFAWDPAENLLDEMLWAKNIRFDDADLVIPIKFPTYLVEHPNKVVWLLHQYRQAYDIRDAGKSNIPETPRGQQIIEAIRRTDIAALSAARKVFTIAPTVSDRLWRYNGVASTVLRHPLNDPELFVGGPSDGYILATGRMTAIKRQHLLIEALVHAPGLRLVVAGPADEPTYIGRLRSKVERLGLQDRVTLDIRYLPRSELVHLVNHAQAVAYAPFDEDSIGYCTMEAFRASKPVITTTDSGGILDIVADGENGLIAQPDAEHLGAAFRRIGSDSQLAERMGRKGREDLDAKGLNWPSTIERLLA
jgi:glycosyltransferase involved in cell wall biosynthesis